jgi:hypothetical protein
VGPPLYRAYRINLSTDCIRDETRAERKSQRGLWLGVNAFAAYDLDRPIAFDHLICDGINADGGYVLASRVSVDFPESDLLQFFYRYQRLVHTGSSFSRHRRSTASGHGVLA